MKIREKVISVFKAQHEENGLQAPNDISDELILMESGLDSLDYAILVVRLEIELGYDPFTIMKEPFYPRTFGEFVRVYDKYKNHAKS